MFWIAIFPDREDIIIPKPLPTIRFPVMDVLQVMKDVINGPMGTPTEIIYHTIEYQRIPTS